MGEWTVPVVLSVFAIAFVINLVSDPLIHESPVSRSMFYFALLVFVMSTIIEFGAFGPTSIQMIASRLEFVSFVIILALVIGNQGATYYGFGVFALLIGGSRYTLGYYRQHLKPKMDKKLDEISKDATKSSKEIRIAIDAGQVKV